jgi:UDP-N-acetylglucosamine 4,6-dehydratase/5-epimerase
MTLNNSNILITGGTGSFGKKFIQLTAKKFKPNRMVIFSRDEIKQWELKNEFGHIKNLEFIIGDIRDATSISNALSGIDFVVHAAATKIVPTAEKNPVECIKTNINGAINLIEASKKNKIKKLVALSTDKACNPINLYGATKLASDKLFVASNFNKNSHKTIFSVVRYGNVMESRGSIIPFFKSISSSGVFPITDKRMTRFIISLEDAVKLVWKAFDKMLGGEIFVKKIPSIKVVDIAKAINIKNKINVIGIRPGEKIHEEMISESDSIYTYEYKDYYKILTADHLKFPKKMFIGSKKVKENFKYTSEKNSEWWDYKVLKKHIS